MVELHGKVYFKIWYTTSTNVTLVILNFLSLKCNIFGAGNEK